jgi:hypothetical protein
MRSCHHLHTMQTKQTGGMNKDMGYLVIILYQNKELILLYSVFLRRKGSELSSYKKAADL